MASRLEFFHTILGAIGGGHKIHATKYTIKKEWKGMFGHPHRGHDICLFSLVGGRGLLEFPSASLSAAAGADLRRPGPPRGHLLSALREARRLGHRAAGTLASTQAPTRGVMPGRWQGHTRPSWPWSLLAWFREEKK